MEDNKFTEVKETKKISEETKKTQDKIILITRITGVVIFLVGISIIFITAIFKSKQPIDDNVIEYESSADNIALYPEDQELLSEEYVVLYSMEDYNKLLNTFIPIILIPPIHLKHGIKKHFQTIHYQLTKMKI